MKKTVKSNDVPLPSSGSILINQSRIPEDYYGRDNGTYKHQGTSGH